jgi:SAM-dependent methyltransferase
MTREPHRLVMGIDVSHGMLANARRHYGDSIQLLGGLASGLPVGDETIDLLYSIAVLHHLPHEDQESAVAEARRVLRPGGAFFIVESTELSSTSDHLYARSPDDWKDLLERHGLGVVDVTGQEHIDFRRIIRPFKQGLRRSLGLSKKSGAGPPGREATPRARMTAGERLFHACFYPLVLAAYPVEYLLTRTRAPHRANYTCLLSK